MKTAITATLAAIALAGCGTATKTVVRTVTAPESAPSITASTTTAAASASPPDCRSLGSRGEGRCVANGVALLVVNRGHEARLHTLAAMLNGCRTTQSVSDGYGQSATAIGVYVICSLTVRNRADGPESFGDNGEQTLLLVDGKHYSDAFDAENQADQQSFVSQSGDIQPALSRTGDVVFDIPSRLAAAALSRGVVLTVDFGTDLNSATTAAAMRMHE